VENKQSSQVLIYVPEITSRIEYTFRFIFQSILGTELIFTSNKDEFLRSTEAKINYSNTILDSGLFIKAHQILFENTIVPQEIITIEYRNMQFFFPSSYESFFPFDPFAFAFYLLSRLEEYHHLHVDHYGRFPDTDNILVKLGLHQKPIVDLMAYWIANELKAVFPKFNYRNREFKFLATIDIDNAWAYKNKGSFVTIGAILKAAFYGKWKEIGQRVLVMLGHRKDPFDTYQYLRKTFIEHSDLLMFFVLMGDRADFDKSISHRNHNFQKLIVELTSVYEVGIHPSFASNNHPHLIAKEIARLEKISCDSISKSRQHFLKLKFPETYQMLLHNGIKADYTMGFASLAGFRAGTCTPFGFFDLSSNQNTSLMIHPFQLMDVSLKNYLSLNVDEAKLMIATVMDEVKNVNGTFISLWHNESVSDWEQWRGWRDVFEFQLQTALNFQNEPS
jgi:hypothetical protein